MNRSVAYTWLRAARLLSVIVLAFAFVALPAGCKKPKMPNLTGPGKLMDITQVRRGMSPNEVRRIMGNNYKLIWEEGMQGMDMGIYSWDYPQQGRVYFNYQGAFKVDQY